MEKRIFVVFVCAFIAAIMAVGCGEAKWDIFKDSSFSISYPVMKMGNDLNENLILHTGNSQCQLTVNKYARQADVKGFAGYVKGLLANESAATIQKEDVTDSEADFDMRVIYSNRPYLAKMKLMSCKGDMYQIMMNCQESGYDKNADDVSAVMGSAKCI